MSPRVAERADAYRARYKQFGLRYAVLAPLQSLAGRASRRLAQGTGAIEAALLKIEGQEGVLGSAHRAYTGHSPSENRGVWSAWDWSRGGEEWNDPDEPAQWKASLIEEVLLPHLRGASTVLEIGPGGGRWSEVLQPRAEHLVLVDVTNRALELCRERFAAAGNVEYVLTDGGVLPGIEPAAIDFVWSFDVFVHIAPVDINSYLGEIARVLRPASPAVIHHSGRVELGPPGWRSPMTAPLFANLARQHGLDVERQFNSWCDGRFGVRARGDVITVLRAPARVPEIG